VLKGPSQGNAKTSLTAGSIPLAARCEAVGCRTTVSGKCTNLGIVLTALKEIMLEVFQCLRNIFLGIMMHLYIELLNREKITNRIIHGLVLFIFIFIVCNVRKIRSLVLFFCGNMNNAFSALSTQVLKLVNVFPPYYFVLA
jgi:hypothetical protein